VSGHGFQPCRKAQKEILPYAVGWRAAQRSAKKWMIDEGRVAHLFLLFP
jgi:hypothetical protein